MPLKKEDLVQHIPALKEMGFTLIIPSYLMNTLGDKMSAAEIEQSIINEYECADVYFSKFEKRPFYCSNILFKKDNIEITLNCYRHDYKNEFTRSMEFKFNSDPLVFIKSKTKIPFKKASGLINAIEKLTKEFNDALSLKKKSINNYNQNLNKSKEILFNAFGCEVTVSTTSDFEHVLFTIPSSSNIHFMARVELRDLLDNKGNAKTNKEVLGNKNITLDQLTAVTKLFP